jgi:UDP-N-acetylglucosamine 2-epimerase
MVKVLCVFGTRPEAIKMAPVIMELRKRPEAECRVCVTAQHRQMLDQVLRLFQIEPDYDLNIMQDDQSLSYVTAMVLTELEGVIQKEKPDWVVVLREVTERPEGVEAGTVQVVSVEREAIVRETVRLLEDGHAYEAMASAVNPYGDGRASERIVQALLDFEAAVGGLS